MKEELELDPEPHSWARMGSRLRVENSRYNGLEAGCVWNSMSDRRDLEDILTRGNVISMF